MHIYVEHATFVNVNKNLFYNSYINHNGHMKAFFIHIGSLNNF